MKTWHFKIVFPAPWSFVFACLGILLFSFELPAQTKPSSPQSQSKDQKIQITAEKLETFSDKNLARFSGNVRATQADTVITSDVLDIYYEKSGEKTQQEPATGQGAVKRVVATGNVKIRTENRTADADQADYTAETGVIVLTGENARVTTGNDSVSGSKITLFREEERITVESGGKKRVEAIIYSGDQELMK